jgi:hypothetical protein
MRPPLTRYPPLVLVVTLGAWLPKPSEWNDLIEVKGGNRNEPPSSFAREEDASATISAATGAG